MASLDKFLNKNGLSRCSEFCSKLKSAGYTMELLSECTVDDIHEIVKELKLSKKESANLQRAMDKIWEQKTDKLQTIDCSEGTALSNMHQKITSIQRALNTMTRTEFQINKQRKICEQSIESIFTEMEQALHRRKEEVIERLHRMVQIKLKIVRTQRSAVIQAMKQAQSIKLNCDRMIAQWPVVTDPRRRKVADDKRKQFILEKQREMNNVQLKYEGNPNMTVPLIFDTKSEREHLLHSISKFGKIENAPKYDEKSKSKTKRKRKREPESTENMFVDQWDAMSLGDNLKLSADKKRVICSETQSYCYRTCFGQKVEDKGTHHWTLRITECQNGYCAWNMVVGTMKIENGEKHPIYNDEQQTKLYHRNSHFTAEQMGYGFIGNLGRLTKDDGHGPGRQYGQPFMKKDDIIEVFLDLEERTLSYKINGKGYGTAFDCLDETRYCLAVTFCGNGNEIEMLRYDTEKYKS